MEITNRKLSTGQLATFFFDKNGFITVQVNKTQYVEPFGENKLELELKLRLAEIRLDALKKESAMGDINMKVAVEVEGKEGLDLTLNYKNTDMKTVLKVENKLVNGLLELLQEQSKGIKL